MLKQCGVHNRVLYLQQSYRRVMISNSNKIEDIHVEKMMVTRTNSFPISAIDELSVCHKVNQEKTAPNKA